MNALDRLTFEQALLLWGPDFQIDMAIEEMAELTVKLSHIRRDRATHIAEEIADVLIMMDQLMLIFGNQGKVRTWYQNKMARLRARVVEEHRSR